MLADVGSILLEDHRSWLIKSIVKEPRFVAVYGAVDSGKSALMQAAVRAQDLDGVQLFYWDLAPVGRSLSTPEKFWSAFGRVFGVEAPGDLSDEDDIEGFIELVISEAPGGDAPILLVLDHWDLALDDPLQRIDSLAQDQLNGYLLDRHEHGRNHARELRIVTLVESPNAEAFVAWAREREARAPGLQAMSKTLERRFAAVRMPFLSRTAASQILRASGFDRGLADTLAKFTGGWLALLDVAQAAQESGRDIDKLVVDAVPRLLAKASWPALRRSFPPLPDETETGWFARVAQALMSVESAEEKLAFYGFPTVRLDAGKAGLAQAVLECIPQPRFLLVDLENLAGGPDARPGVAHVQDARSLTIRLIAEQVGVSTENILIFARNKRRAESLLGPVRRSWRVVTTNLPESVKARKREQGEKDNSDDVVLAAWFAHIATTHPFAHLNVISGDNDFWGGLSELVGPGHEVVQIVQREGDNQFLSRTASDWMIDDTTRPWAEREARRQLSRAEKGRR